MPILKNARVLSSQQTWASPDGQRKLFEVTVTTEQGQTLVLKSWSERLQGGFSGDLETYEKANNKGGMDTFVRQAPKEGGFSPQGSPRSGFGGGGSKPASDPFTMYLSYAKDIMVACLTAGGVGLPAGKNYTDLLDIVLEGGHKLYDGRPGAEPKQTVLGDTVTGSDPVHPPTDDQLNDGIKLEDIPF